MDAETPVKLSFLDKYDKEKYLRHDNIAFGELWMVAGIRQGCGSKEPCRHSLRVLVLYVPDFHSAWVRSTKRCP